MSSSFHGGKCSMPSSTALRPITVPPSHLDTAPAQRRAGLAAGALLVAIRAYKLIVSPYLPGACRFTPTCSDYAAGAIATFGAVRGTWLAARRVARCRPWGGHGVDPIPQR
jgi:putative membrane protein insertion efficiency factor